MIDYEAKIIDGYEVKMDAVSLQGVWLNFPQAAASGRLTFAAGYYLWLQKEEEERRRKKPKGETPAQQRRRLVDEVEARIVRDDQDDLFVMTI